MKYPSRSLLLNPLALVATLILLPGCGRDGPRPENKDDRGYDGEKHSAHGTTGIGGAKNSLTTDPAAGSGLSGTRPDDDIPVEREGR